MVLWGTFAQRDSDGNIPQGIVLLDGFAGRLDFPALKMKAVEMQELWRPDYLLIENKRTGMPLIQELLRAGIFAQEANPHRGSDKVMRTNAVADLLKSGLVWARWDCAGWSRCAMRWQHFPTGKTTTCTTPRFTVCYASARAG
jgi:phage terminase large subunit-like protein